LTGIYLSEHPLKEVLANGQTDGVAQIIDLAERPAGDKVRVIGMIKSVRRVITKKNRSMAIIDLEDLSGNLELVAFPDCYDQYADLWEPDAIVDVSAKVDRRNEQTQLVCETITTEIKQAAKRVARRAVHLQLPGATNYEQDLLLMQEVFQIIMQHEGDDEVVIHVPTARGRIALRSRSHGVEWNDGLQTALKLKLGSQAVELILPALAS
jgi:DNA polymerase-3 subunit alpha